MGVSTKRFLRTATFVLFLSIYSQAADHPTIREGFKKTADGVSIHYLETGSNNSAQTLVLIPGWRLPAYLWKEQLQKFGATERVIAVDPRSQGQSTKTADGNTPEQRARDLHDILAQMGVSRPVLVGWSQGAQDVSAYVAQFGNDSVAGVVLVDSPVSAGPAEVDLRPAFSKAILGSSYTYATHPKEFSEGMVQSLFKLPHPELDIPAIVKSTLQTPTNTGVAMLIADIFGTDRRPALAKLNKPALVIASASSPLLDAQTEMAASVSGAKFVAVDDSAHAVFIDQPEKFDQALQEFLKTVQ
jgi:microsomal epoxide hydrolase